MTPSSASGGLTPSYNNIGISDDANPRSADLDNAGYSYSAQSLQAVGLGSGQSVTAAGLTFQWPNTLSGTADDVWAQGQTITFTAPLSGNNLGFLGMAANGPATGNVVINYVDGSTQSLPLTFSDWTLSGGASGISPGDTVVATMAGRNSKDGFQHLTTYVFEAGVPLIPMKPVASITLPATLYPVQIHIFAVSVG